MTTNKLSKNSNASHKLLRGNRRRQNNLAPCLPLYSSFSVRSRES